MEDHEIVQLYWDRAQGAIPATAEKYGRYCASIARNILENPEDTEECVNDAYLRAWNAMPPHRPAVLSAFLGKLVRNLAFHRYQKARAQKRGGGEVALALDELAECVSGGDAVEQALDRQALTQALDTFLGSLRPRERQLFLCRYWYADRVADIAGRFGLTANHVSVTLSRTRAKLRAYLTERGFDV